MLFTLQSCVKTYSYQKWNMGFFVLFNQQTLSLFTNSMFFLLCSISHAFANPLCFLKWFICFDYPYTVFILIYPHRFLLYPVDKVCWLRVVLISHAALPHKWHTVFKAIMNMMNTMIEKQKIVQCHWLVKIGEKKQDEMEKNWVLRLLTMEEAGSKRALGQKNSCESEHWKYSRKPCFSVRRRSVLIASRTSPYS